MTTRQMIDSAYPMKAQPTPLADIVLIYAGGDTVHPWSTAEILAMPNRYRWPCWVRSNPQQASVVTDIADFVAWLHGHKVPKGTAVILDLEMAIDAGYVSAFNLGLRAAGYKVTKYGSQDFIWANPQTDGGTFVALPGHPDALSAEGDTVATQYAFDGMFDRSVVKDQAALPLWDTKPPHPKPGPLPSGEYQADGHTSLAGLAQRQGCEVADIWDATFAGLAALGRPPGSLERACLNMGAWQKMMPSGLVLYLP